MNLIARTLIFIFIFWDWSFAHESEICDPRLKQESLDHIADLNKNLISNHWAATPEQIRKAPCKAKTPPTEQEMLRFLDSKKTLGKASAVVNGIQFKDEDPGLLSLFENMHKASSSAGVAAQFQSRCQKVICALQEIYGKKEGVQLAFMAAKYGYNGSHKMNKEASPWKAGELDEILTSLSDYPSSMYPISRGHALVRGPRGLNTGATVANAVIMVFDLWGEQTKWEKHSVIVHELAHNIASNGDKDSSAEWLKLGGWKGKVKPDSPLSSVSRDWKMANEQEAVSDYGTTNPAEDFAETVVAYRYNGMSLKKTHPAKYKYMKEKVFDGIEYDSENSCKQGTRTEQNIAKLEQFGKAQKVPTSGVSGKIINDSTTMKKLVEACRADVVNSLGGSISHTDVCVREKLGGIYLESQAALKGLQVGQVGDQFAQPNFDLDPQVYKDVSAAVKQQVAGEVEKIIKDSSGEISAIRFLGMRSGTEAECKNIGQYVYQSFDKSYSAVSEKDKFFFFNRREQLQGWASRVCSYRSPGAKNLGLGFAWGAGTLREAVSASIP